MIANLYQHLNPDMELLPGRWIPCVCVRVRGMHVRSNVTQTPIKATTPSGAVAPAKFLEVFRLFSTIPYAAGGLAVS